MKKEINDLLLKMQTGENCIGETAENLLALFGKSLTPYKCPVCNGNGLVSNGFYSQMSGHWTTSSTTSEACRSCNYGVVWG